MTQAILGSPMTLNPAQSSKLNLRGISVDIAGQKISASIEMVDAKGVTIDQRTVVLSDAAAQAWVTAQGAPILKMVLANMGLVGTVT